MIEQITAWENSGIMPIIGNLLVFIVGGFAEIIVLKRLGFFNDNKKK